MLINKFLILAGSLLVSLPATAGRDLSGGGTVVYLSECKRPILLDILQYRIKHKIEPFCDDDGEEGFKVELGNDTVLKANTTIIGNREFRQRVFKSIDPNIDRSAINAPVLYKQPFLSAQANKMRKVFLQAWLTKGNLGDEVKSAIYNNTFFAVAEGEVPFYFFKQDFDLEETSYYLSLELKKRFPKLKIRHVAVSGLKTAAEEDDTIDNGSVGIYHWHPLFINLDVWNQLSLLSQTALLVHENLRGIQFTQDDGGVARGYFRDFSQNEWDKLIQYLVTSIFESGKDLLGDKTYKLDTLSSYFSNYADVAHCPIPSYKLRDQKSTTVQRQNNFSKAAQVYLAKNLNGSVTEVDFRNMMDLKSDNGCFGNTTLLELMIDVGVKPQHILELIDTLMLPMYNYDLFEAAQFGLEDPTLLLNRVFSREYDDYSFVKLAFDKLVSKYPDYNPTDKNIGYWVRKSILSDLDNGEKKIKAALSSGVPASAMGAHLHNSNCPDTFFKYFKSGKLDDYNEIEIFKFCSLKYVKVLTRKRLKEIKSESSIDWQEVGLIWAYSAINSEDVFRYVDARLRKFGLTNEMLMKSLRSKLRFDVADYAISNANLVFLKRLDGVGFDWSSIKGEKYILRSRALANEADIFAMLDYLRALQVDISIEMPPVRMEFELDY